MEYTGVGNIWGKRAQRKYHKFCEDNVNLSSVFILVAVSTPFSFFFIEFCERGTSSSSGTKFKKLELSILKARLSVYSIYKDKLFISR